MSEKTTSITEAIQSGDKIPPSVYQMWIEDLIKNQEVMIEALRQISKVGLIEECEDFLRFCYSETNHAKCLDIAFIALEKVGELP